MNYLQKLLGLIIGLSLLVCRLGHASEAITVTGHADSRTFRCTSYLVREGRGAHRLPLTLPQIVRQAQHFCSDLADGAAIERETARTYRAYELLEAGSTVSRWLVDEPELYLWTQSMIRVGGGHCDSIHGLDVFRDSYVISCDHGEHTYVVRHDGTLAGL
jgi:hypothetical protein